VNEAVKSAAAAFKRNSIWRTMDASARGKILVRVGEIMMEQKHIISVSVVLDAPGY